jgi:hypothetical protein
MSSKRVAEGPPEDLPDEKRPRLELTHKSRMRRLLVDPDTWVSCFSGESYISPSFGKHLTKCTKAVSDALYYREDRLHIVDCPITSVPPIVFLCGLFREVALFSCQSLVGLPSEIGMWEGRFLFVGGSGIQSLPREIGNCKNLTCISLCDTRITVLPFELGKCPLTDVFLGREMCEERDGLKQFLGLSSHEVAAKLRREWNSWNSTVSNFCQALFPVEDRDPEKPYDRLGDLPLELKKLVHSFLF